MRGWSCRTGFRSRPIPFHRSNRIHCCVRDGNRFDAKLKKQGGGHTCCPMPSSAPLWARSILIRLRYWACTPMQRALYGFERCCRGRRRWRSMMRVPGVALRSSACAIPTACSKGSCRVAAGVSTTGSTCNGNQAAVASMPMRSVLVRKSAIRICIIWARAATFDRSRCSAPMR